MAVAISLAFFGARAHILFIIKVEILKVIEWSHHIYERVVQSLLNS